MKAGPLRVHFVKFVWTDSLWRLCSTPLVSHFTERLRDVEPKQALQGRPSRTTPKITRSNTSWSPKQASHYLMGQLLNGAHC